MALPQVFNTILSAFGIQPKKFRYSLIIRGIETEVLKNAPDGWLQTKIEYNRSVETSGVIRALTLPMTFTYTSAMLLRREYYQYGLLADVKLQIERFNSDVAIWDYQVIFLGKIDFSQFKDEQNQVTVNATEDNLNNYIDAFGDTDYSIPLDVPEAITLNLSPITLKETATLTMVNRNNPQADTFPGLTIVTNQQNSVDASVFAVQSRFQTDPDLSDGQSKFFQARVDGKVRVQITFDIFLAAAVGTYAIWLQKQSGEILKTIYTYTNPGGGGNPIQTVHVGVDLDFLINVSKDDFLTLYFDSSRDGLDGQGFLISGNTTGQITLSYDTTSPASQCKAVSLLYMFNQLMMRMSQGANYTIQSVLLTSTLANIYLTSSDAIRKIDVGQTYDAGDTLQAGGTYLVLSDTILYNGLTYQPNTYFTYKLGVDTFSGDGFVQQVAISPQLITNWNDFLKSISGLMGGQAGFGVEGSKSVLEDLSYFFRANQNTVALGDINNFSCQPDTDRGANTLKIGYEDQQYNSINGSQEVNSTQNYASYALLPNNELDLTIPYRADPHGIEETRIQPVDSASSKSDNDVFMIRTREHPESDGSYSPLLISEADSYSGVDGSYYNFLLSPKHNLYRGGAYLRSVFANQAGYKLNPTSALKNDSMVVIYQGQRVAEAEPVEISSLPQPLFGSNYVTVSPGLSPQIYKVLNAAPYGYVAFNYRGRVWKAFIADVITDQGENSTQDWKLLLTADNNLDWLVH